MYIEKNLGEIDGFFSTIKNIVSKATLAPGRVVSDAVSGKSITGSIDKNITQAVGKGLMTSGYALPVIAAVAGVFTAGAATAAIIMAVKAAEAAKIIADLHHKKDMQKAGSAQAIAIQKQIDATRAQIDKLKASDPAYAKEFDAANKPAQYIKGVPNKVLAGGAAAAALLAMTMLG